MTGAVLGLDTSCYTTSCALVNPWGQVIADKRKMLLVPFGGRGLRQSEAVFQHIRGLPGLMEQAMEQAVRPDIIAVCASETPLDAPRSYMPVFLSGASFGKAISAVLKVPYYGTTHQRGHFAAAEIGTEKLNPKHLAVHLSGGTTEITLREGDSIRHIGGSRDISAGQLLDRIGVMLGFSFPAGLQMEKLAAQGNPTGRYPSAVKEGDLHFSGAEAAAKRDFEQKALTPADIAAELFDVISRSLVKLCLFAAQQTKACDILVTGGVASSGLLREQLPCRAEKHDYPFRFHFGSPAYSGDNAAGVAMIGLRKYYQQKEGRDGGYTER